MDSNYEVEGDFTTNTGIDEEYVVREDSPNSVLSQVHSIDLFLYYYCY
jgi:hypothetical protein